MTPEEATQKLFQAVREANASDAKEALEAKANVHARDGVGRTPLHWAVEMGATDVVDDLIKKRAQRNAMNDRGQTPLHLAVENGDLPIAEMLLKKEVADSDKADPSVEDNWGRTPLDYAMRMRKSAYDDDDKLIKMLQAAVKDQQGHAARVIGRRGHGSAHTMDR